MIFISNQTNLSEAAKSHLNTIKLLLQTKTQYNNILNSYIEIIINTICSTNNHIDNNKLHKILSELNNNINEINTVISYLEQLLNSLTNLIDSNYNKDYFDEKKYNSLYESTIENCLKIDTKTNNLFNELHNFITKTLPENNIHIKINNLEIPTNFIITDNKLEDTKEIEQLVVPENTLLISELKNKVYLPYTKNDLNSIMQKSINCSLNDIIETHFTVPLDSFKNLSISRFKAAFKLMRNIEKASLTEAFDLGLEVFFNHNLHPAIILGCRSLNELDIYLDCLESNETDKFNCFSIIFEIAPILKTKLAFGSNGKHKANH